MKDTPGLEPQRLVPGTDGLRFVTHHANKWEVDASEVDLVDIELEMGEEGFTVSLRGRVKAPNLGPSRCRIRQLEERMDALVQDTVVGMGKQMNHLAARLDMLLGAQSMSLAAKLTDEQLVEALRPGRAYPHPTAEEVTRATEDAFQELSRAEVFEMSAGLGKCDYGGSFQEPSEERLRSVAREVVGIAEKAVPGIYPGPGAGRVLYVIAGTEPTERERRTIQLLQAEGCDVQIQAYDECFGTDHTPEPAGRTYPHPTAAAPDLPSIAAEKAKADRHQLHLRVDVDFVYHPPKPDQLPKYAEIRDHARFLAHMLVELVPPGRELSLALTKLEECVMHANSGVARHG